MSFRKLREEILLLQQIEQAGKDLAPITVRYYYMKMTGKESEALKSLEDLSREEKIRVTLTDTGPYKLYSAAIEKGRGDIALEALKDLEPWHRELIITSHNDFRMFYDYYTKEFRGSWDGWEGVPENVENWKVFRSWYIPYVEWFKIKI